MNHKTHVNVNVYGVRTHALTSVGYDSAHMFWKMIITLIDFRIHFDDRIFYSPKLSPFDVD